MSKRIFFSIIASLSVTLATKAQQPASLGREVVVVNPVDSVKLSGTLSVPAKQLKGAVILATGSGIQNRDEEVFGHRPFKVLADELSAAGYAVLRMDDRGYDDDELLNLYSNYTTDTYVTDIAAGIDYLKTNFPDSKIGIIGHSEGGTVAIKSAAPPEGVSFIVTLAAPAWSGDSIVMSQARAIANHYNGTWDGEKAQRQILDIVKSSLPEYQKRAYMTQTIAHQLGDVFKLPEVQNSMMLQINGMLTPYYIDMIRYEPSLDIVAVNIPWLALNGDKDIQVLPENLNTIKKLNPKVETILLPDHNHLFQNCITGTIDEYETIAEDISPQTIQAIIRWLDQTIPLLK